MRIGSQESPDRTLGLGPRRTYQAPEVPYPSGSGLTHVADALSSVGRAVTPYLERRIQEENEAQDFADLERRHRFDGEWSRRAVELRRDLPPDGRGYVDRLQPEFQKFRDQFLQDISVQNRGRYSAHTESVWQGTVLEADDFTRSATRGHAERRVNEAVERARLEVYQNPDNEALFEQIAELIDAAPGLEEGEKLDLERKALEALRGASVGGRIRQTREGAYTAAYSLDVRDRILPALVQAESGGNPLAISSAGAAGLTQVMPDTARDIAIELEDFAFPISGSREDVQAYLTSNKSIALQYGERYLNKQLQRYGGDIEAALVAYNAGPKNADMWMAAGRNYAVLPKTEETQPYVQRVFANMGAMTPEMVFDPQYGLTLDQALAAEGQLETIYARAQADAVANVAAQQVEIQRQRDALLSQMMYDTQFNGLDFPNVYRAAVDSGQLAYEQEAFNRGVGVFENVNRELIATQEAVGKMMRGLPLSQEDASRLTPPQMVEQIVARDEGAMQDALNLTRHTGSIPPPVAQAVQQMLYSPNMEDVFAAAQFVRAAEEIGPSFVASLPDDMVARASSAIALNDAGVPGDRLAEIMTSTTTTEGRQALTRLKETDDGYEDNQVLSTDDVTDFFDRSWLPGRTGVEVPRNAMVRNMLQLQYAKLYDSFYSSTWDGPTAKRLALEQIKKTWGASDLGGRARVMYLPPEQTLQSLRRDTDGDGELEDVKLPPSFITSQFDKQLRRTFGLEGQYIPHATPDTLSAVREGRPVPYMVWPVDEDGEPSWDFEQPGHLRMLQEPFLFDASAINERLIAVVQLREKWQVRLHELEQQARGGVLAPELKQQADFWRERIRELDEELE